MKWDARISTTSILRTPPSWLHESVVRSLDSSFILQVPVQEPFLVSAGNNERVPGVGSKVPDLMVRFDVPVSGSSNEFDSVPILFSEVGYSEKASDLEESMRMWFDTFPTINMGFLAKIDERPKYRKPFRSHTRGKVSYFLQNPEASYKQKIVSQNPEEAGSPLYLSDFRLVGETKAYMEIWTRDAKTQKAMKKGDRIVSHANSRDQND